MPREDVNLSLNTSKMTQDVINHFQQTLLSFNVILILAKSASNAIQQHGLYHQRDATPHHIDEE
jgi:hypothetical protein